MNYKDKEAASFVHSLVQNQDLLLSSNVNTEPAEAPFDYLSFINNGEPSAQFFYDDVNPILQQNLNNQTEQLNTPEGPLDLNLCDYLQDDPEVAEILESFNRVNYLPQISVNTTNQILGDNLQTINDSNNTMSFLDKLIKSSNSFENKNNLNRNDSINDLSNILGLASNAPSIQTKITLDNDIKIDVDKLETKNTKTPRTSLRLVKKRENNNNNNKKIEKEIKSEKVKQVNDVCKKRPSLKRRFSLLEEEFEDEKESVREAKETIVCLNNESSMSSMNDDYIYCNEEDDDDDGSFNSESDDKSTTSAAKRRSRRGSSTNTNGTTKETDSNKKESNKEAATRYRMKKISEKDKLFDTRQTLEKENGEVKRRIELVQTEINYLKSLLVQMLITQGALSNIG